MRAGRSRPPGSRAATTVSLPTRRRLGSGSPVAGAAHFGLHRHVRVAPSERRRRGVHWAQDAECYVRWPTTSWASPSSPRTAAAPGRSGWLRPCGRRGVAQASRVHDRGAGPLRQRATRSSTARCCSSATPPATIDTLTGEGLAAGFAQADELVRAVAPSARIEAAARWVTHVAAAASPQVARSDLAAVAAGPPVPAAHLPRVFGGSSTSLALRAGPLL